MDNDEIGQGTNAGIMVGMSTKPIAKERLTMTRAPASMDVDNCDCPEVTDTLPQHTFALFQSVGICISISSHSIPPNAEDYLYLPVYPKPFNLRA